MTEGFDCLFACFLSCVCANKMFVFLLYLSGLTMGTNVFIDIVSPQEAYNNVFNN